MVEQVMEAILMKRMKQILFITHPRSMTRPNIELEGTLEPIKLKTWESKLIFLSLKGGSNKMISMIGFA